jgi:hypothetical protein
VTLPGSAAALAFYTDVLHAVEISRECLLDGYVLAVDLQLGPYQLHLTDEAAPIDPEAPAVPLTCPDAAAVLARAAAVGAVVEGLPGPRTTVAGVVRDPAGNRLALLSGDIATSPARTVGA